MTDEEIMKMARICDERYPHNPMFLEIENFERINYRMPRDLKEVQKFIKQVAKEDGIQDWNAMPFYPWTPGLDNFKQLLSSPHSYLISYSDSCFFYNSTWRVGCVVYESHCSLINTDVRDSRIRPIGFIDSQGLNRIDWEKEKELYSQIQIIASEYSNVYKMNRNYSVMKSNQLFGNPDYLGVEPLWKETEYRRILICTRDNPPAFLCDSAIRDSLWIETRDNSRHLPLPAADPDKVCLDFISRVYELAQEYLRKDNNCVKILIPIQFVF